jgi:hypothetical protein
MTKKLVFSIFIIFLFLFSGTGHTFVPEAQHLLYLVINKIKQPVGIEVWQTRKLLNYQNSEQAYFEFEEKLIYSYPNQLRSQIISESMANFSVESDFEFIKVAKGVITSHNKSMIDLYSDVLLYRDHETLLNQLALSGIDTTKISFQRYNDTICYVIGTPPEQTREKNSEFPGLWIEKETFLPLRYLVEKNGKRVEFFYKNWQKVSKTFYPMQVHIFLDNRLVSMLNVNSFDLRSGFLPILFDIDNIVNIYPEDNHVDGKERNETSIMETDSTSAPVTQQRHE